MTLEIRTLGAADWEQHIRVQTIAFGSDPHPAQPERRRAILEADRGLLALVDGVPAGSAGALRIELSVPGGTVPCAGVTMVGVLPTHRRMGILSALMRRQLDDARSWREPVAALWASEAGIYGRFGYGLAASGSTWRIERTRTALRGDGRSEGTVRLVTPEEAESLVPPLYDRLRQTTPGHISRSPTWWRQRHFDDPESRREGFSSARWVVVENEGRVTGWAAYRQAPRDVDRVIPAGTVRVVELHATHPAAERRLWEYVFGVDLVEEIEALERPAEDPLLHMLVDARRLRRTVYDTLWVRLVDVPAALEARRYRAAGSVVFELSDPFCPWNAGRYHLALDGERARCTRTTDPATLSLDAEALGSVYLGGTSLQALAAAGRVSGEEGAIRQAHAMFAWSPAPWCPEIF